MIQSAGA